MEHMCWMNLGKAAPLLFCLRKITFTISVWDYRVFSSAFHQNWTNMKYEHQVQDDITTFMVQHTAPGFKDLAEAKHPPSSTQQTLPWISKQILAGQKAICGNRLVEQCTPAQWWDGQTDSLQQPYCSACLWEILCGMSSPGALCASAVDLCKTHFKE